MKRIQRRRTKGWRMPPNAVYVGRPSKWGNPHLLVTSEPSSEDCCRWACYEDDGCLCVGCMTPEKAVWLYREDLEEQIGRGAPLPFEELRGRDLACWCDLSEPCHADVLLELANPSPHRSQASP